MPFTTTISCREEEWTHIFENIIKPSVINSGLDFSCKRAKATRGNVVRDIVNDLYQSYVVIADLTDRNPNVFYELGVRHALTERTILIAQKEEDIPSDLKSYAYHIYEWKTDEGKKRFALKMKELLLDIEQKPEKPDSPVSDFLKGRKKFAAYGPLRDLVEFDMDENLVFKFDPQEATGKEAIGLVLYSHNPLTLTSKAIDKSLSKCWRDVGDDYVRATLSQLGGNIRKEQVDGGVQYGLSGSGVGWVERTVIPKLRGK